MWFLRIFKHLMSNKQIHAQIPKLFKYIHITKIVLSLSPPRRYDWHESAHGQGTGG